MLDILSLGMSGSGGNRMAAIGQTEGFPDGGNWAASEKDKTVGFGCRVESKKRVGS